MDGDRGDGGNDGKELGRLLKSRRARLSPTGLALDTGRRRVAGLRREEVASLAGISVEYYVRLEQGRAVRPSDSVLDALARALELDEIERAHLNDLAHRRQAGRRASRVERVRPELMQLLRRMDRAPALVFNHRQDVLAWNHLSAQLFFDFDRCAPRDRNLARYAFLDETSRSRFGDWADAARASVGQLRLAAARHGDDAALATLLGELTMNSEDFRTMWGRRDVRQRTHGSKTFVHPVVGALSLRYQSFQLPGESELQLVAFHPEPGGPAESALELLAMWTTESV